MVSKDHCPRLKANRQLCILSTSHWRNLSFQRHWNSQSTNCLATASTCKLPDDEVPPHTLWACCMQVPGQPVFSPQVLQQKDLAQIPNSVSLQVVRCATVASAFKADSASGGGNSVGAPWATNSPVWPGVASRSPASAMVTRVKKYNSLSSMRLQSTSYMMLLLFTPFHRSPWATRYHYMPQNQRHKCNSPRSFPEDRIPMKPTAKSIRYLNNPRK